MPVHPTETSIQMSGPGIPGKITPGQGWSGRLSPADVRSFATVYSQEQCNAAFVSLAGAYSNPAWITALDAAKITGLSASLAAKADLVGGIVPAHQLPSYVDDVVEAADFAALPGTGESGKIYVALATGKTYRWSGTAYVELTDATAVWGQVSGVLTNQTDLMSYLSANYSASGHTHAFANLTDKPTTLSGYGITDAYPLSGNPANFVSASAADAAYVSLAASYANPAWIASIAQNKVTGLVDALAAKADLVGGLVPAHQLPSYVDDVVEAADFASLPGTGESGKIYVVLATGKTYRWSGSAYVELTDATAVWGQISGTLSNQTDLMTHLSSNYVPQVRTVNGLALSSNQTFAVGATGNDFGIASVGSTHTFNIPDASATARGLVTTGAQTLAGGKTFSGNITAQGNLSLPGNGGLATWQQDGVSFGGGARLVGTGNGVQCWITVQNGPLAAFTNANGLVVGGQLGFESNFGATGTPTLVLLREGSDILGQRRTTNAQTFRLYNSFASTTSFENLQFKANTGAAYQIGSSVGSAGGTNRHIDFGSWNAAGAWTSLLTWDSNNILTSTVGFQVSGELNMIRCQSSGFGSEQDGSGLIIYSNGWQAWPSRTGFHSRTGQNANSGRTGFIHSTTHTNAAFNSFFDWRTAAPGELGTTSIMRLAFDGSLVLSQAAAAPGWGVSPTILTVIGAPHTTLPATIETTDINFNLARTVQFAAGALTTQRAVRIQAPTYGFVGASTITTASTLSISGAPMAGTNATITNAYALNVESGRSRLGGNLFVDGGTSTFGGGLVIGPFTGFGVSTDYIRAETSWSVEPHLLGYPWHFAWVDNVPKVTMQTIGGSHSGVRIASDCAISIVSTTNSKTGTPDVNLWRDAANVLAQRNSTNAQTFRVYGTHTSSTSYELLEMRGVSGANFEIGPENGSAGGTLRGLTLGGYSGGSSTITPWLTFTNTGAATFGHTLTVANATTFNSSVIAESANVFIRTASLYFDTYGTHNGIRHRRANGTFATPSEVTTNDLIAFWNVVGYHDGGGGAKAFHTQAAAGIYMYASENFTPTACGGNIRFLTTPTGSTTLTTRMVINHDGRVAIGGNNTVPSSLVHLISTTEQLRVGFDASNYYSTAVSSAGAVTFDAVGASAGFTFSDRVTFSRLAGQTSAEITNTPTGTTQTITLNDGNHQTLSLVSATGAVAVTLTVPSNVASGTFIVRQHGATPRNLTWAVSSGSIKWLGTQPTWSSDAVNSFRVVSWRWNGSVMFLTSSASGV
jgi:hypothetical protein